MKSRRREPADLLGALVKAAQAGSFHGRNVHEDILAGFVWLYKSIALGRVEPLHSTCRHVRTPLFKQWRQLRAVA
jgi:hypothetical protein